MRALPSWVKGFIYSFLCIFTLAQSGFGQSPATASAFGKLPLSFEPNQGQTAGEVQFLSRGRGYTLFLSSSDSVLALHRGHRGSRTERMEAGPSSAAAPAALRMHLVGGNRSAQGVAEEALPGKSNYFIGNDRSKWRTDVPNYGRVRYRGVYPGIDLVYYGNQRLLEHDFEVAPGADPRRIRLAFQGIQRAVVEKSGDLVLQLTDGEVRLQKPAIYQNTEQGRREVTGGFVLRKSQVTIQVGAYDRRRALVIDPVLSYSTYLGGTGEDAGSAVATDSSGNVYVVGLTASTAANGFPITTQLSATGCAAVAPAGCSGTTDDVFIVKINPSGTGGTAGTALVYSTFLGGNGDDEGYGISVDGSNNAYVTGFTASTDFPLSASPYQSTIGSFQGSAFVTKIGAGGNTLLYSTYLGGHARDWGNAITQDSGGNIYVTGVAFSRDFPTLTTLVAPPVTLYASGNAGASWTAASGSTSFQVTAFAVDRNTAGTVYAGQVGSGVIKSTDFGATWTATVATQSYSNALVLDPTTGANAVLYEGSRFGGVRRITGGGTGSTFINSGLTSFNVLSLVLDPANNAILYAGLNGRGVWVTTSANGPTPTWTQVTTTGLGDQTINALAFDSATHALYAGTNSGVYQLANGAASWTTVAGGPTGLAVLALAVDSSSNVYAASFGGGLFKLSGGAWTTLNGSGGTALGTLSLRTVAVDPVTPSTIYAAGRSRLGIYKSTDGGSTWSLLNSGLTITSAQTLAIDPASTGNVYVGMVNLMTFVAKFNSGGSPTVLAFFGGASGSTQPNTIAVDDPTSQNMYIGGSTSSASLPTPLVGQTTIGGNTDGFVAKISTVGTPAVVWDRYLGGAFDDVVFSLALDQNRNVDVTGYTTSADFPVSAGAYQNSLKVTPNFGANAFFSEIDPTGATLLYSTYFGGTGGDDEGTGIAVVSAGGVASINVNNGGSGYSSATPPAVAISGGGGSGATATATVSPASGQVTGFVISNPGSGYVSAPAVSIALPSGPGTPATAQAVLSSPLTPLISVAGLTYSSDLPTVNPLQFFNAGGYDTFYAKFDPSKNGATGLLCSTYLGGNSDDYGYFVNNLALDSLGAAWITGQTYSTNFPTTASSAVQPAGSSTVANSGDAFVYKIQTTGNASDIAVTMSPSAGTTVAEGTAFSFNIVVTNNGPNPAGAPSVVLFGVPYNPTHLSVSGIVTTQGTCSTTSNTFTCNLGTVAVGGGGAVSIQVNVTADALATPPSATFTNTVRVATADDDPVPTNNSAAVTMTVQRQADLRINSVTAPNPVFNGTAFNYTVTVANNGPNIATGVVLTYTLPPNVVFNAGTSSANCTQAGSTVTCLPGDILPNFVVGAAVINVTPHATGSLSGTFTVSSSQVVDDGTNGAPGANNTQTFTNTVSANVDLSVTAQLVSPNVPVGGSAAFNITVTNHGSETATGVSFTGTGPAALLYVSFSSSSAGVSCSAAGSVTCTLPDIPSGGTVSFTIFARAVLQGTYVANASVSSSATDLNPSNNATSATVTVVGSLYSNLTTVIGDFEKSSITELNTFGGQTSPEFVAGASPTSIVIAPNGRLAFVGSINASYVSVVDLTIQAEIARIRDVWALSLALNSDGTKIAAVSTSRDELDIIDVATFTVARISLNGNLAIGDVAGTADIRPFSLAVVGNTAYIANVFGPVIVVNFNSPSAPIISTVAGTTGLIVHYNGHQVAATPDGTTVAVYGLPNGGTTAVVYLINTSTNTLTQTVSSTAAGPRSIVITPSANAPTGVVAFLSRGNGLIETLDLRSGSPTYGQLLPSATFTLPTVGTDMAMSPNGGTLQAVSGPAHGAVGSPSTLYTLNAAAILTNPSTALQSTFTIPNSISVRTLAIGYVQNFPLPSAPQVSDVVPQEITNEAAKVVSIFGDNFAAGALVKIGNLDPLPTTFVSPQEVTATVAAGAAVQIGGIVVTLPNTAGGALAANVSGGASFGGGRLQIDPPATFAPVHPVVVASYGTAKLTTLFRDSALVASAPETFSLAISPDGQFAYTGPWELDITNLDTATLQSQAIFPTGEGAGADGIAIAPDPVTGKKVAYMVSCDVATCTADTLYIEDVDTASPTRNTLLRTIPTSLTDFDPNVGPEALAVTPDGRYVYSADPFLNAIGSGTRLVIFDVLNGTSTVIADITTLGADPYQQHIAVAPDGKSLLLSGTGATSIKVYDIQGANATAPVLVTTITGSGAPTTNPPLFYSFQVVGARLFAYASDQRYVQAFNFVPASNNFTALGSYTIPGPAGNFPGDYMVVTPEGTLLYAAATSEDTVAVLDANLVAASSTSSLITKMRTSVNPSVLAVSPRGNASADLEAGLDTSAPLLTSNTFLAALNTPFDLSVHVLNNGPSTATGVNMTLAIPAGVVVNSAFVTDGPITVACTSTTTQVVCPVGTFHTFDSIAVDVNVTATALGSLVFTNTVSGNELDGNPANNAATINVTVQNGADLAITGSASANPAVAGSPVTLTAVVTNSGPDVASAVSAVLFSSANSFLSSTTTQGTCFTEISVVCNLGNIAPGGSVTITATATFVASNASTTGTVNFSGFVSASTADANAGNNFFTLNLPLTNSAAPVEHLFVGDAFTGTLTSLNVSDNAIVASGIPGGVFPNAIAFSPNRHLAFIGNQVDYLTVVDLPTRSELKRIPISGNAFSMAVTPDGTKLVVPNRGQDKVLIIDTTTFQVVQTINLNGLVGDSAALTGDIGFGGIVIANNKAYIATTNPAPKLGVIVINLATNAVSVAAGSNLAHGISFLTSTIAALPDGSAVILPQQGPNQLIRIDTTTDTVTATLALPFAPDGLVITPSATNPTGVFGFVMFVARLQRVNVTSGLALLGSGFNLPLDDDSYMAINSDGTRLYIVASVDPAAFGATPFNVAVIDTTVFASNPSASVITKLAVGHGLQLAGVGFTDLLPEPGSPTITQVTPEVFTNDVDTTLTINGAGFAADSTVKIGTLAALPATFISSNQIQVVVPAGSAAQEAPVVVTNPNTAAPPNGQSLSGIFAGTSGTSNGSPNGVDILPPLSFQPKYQVAVADSGDTQLGFIERELRHRGTNAGLFHTGGIAFAPDGSQFFVPSFLTPTTPSSTSTGVVVGVVGGSSTTIDLRSNPFGDAIATGTNPRTGRPVAYFVSSTSTGNLQQLNLIDADPFSPSLDTVIDSIAGVSTASLTTEGLAVTPDGKYVYNHVGTNPAGIGLVIYDVLNRTATSSLVSTLGIPNSSLRHVEVSPDGKSLILQGATAGQVLVFDIGTNPLSPTLLTTITGFVPTGLVAAPFSASRVVGNHLFIYNPSQNLVEVFNFDRTTSNFSFVNFFIVPGSVFGNGMIVTPDGLIYASLGTLDDGVAIIDGNKLIASAVQGDPSVLITKTATGRRPWQLAVNPKRLDTAPADFGIAISHSPEPVALGSNITFNVTVSDFGPFLGTGNDSNGSNGGFLINFDKSLSPISSSFFNSPFFDCTLSGNQLLCGFSHNGPDPGPPPINISGTLVLQTTTSGSVTVQGKIDGGSYDPNPANNTATDTANVVSADLGVTMTASAAAVAPGANLTYTIVVTNNGPTASSGYTLTDTLPANVTFVSATSGCVLSTVLTCSGPSLGVGLTATYVVVVTPTALGSLSNTASVTGNDADPVPGNNSATTTTNVVAVDLGVTMTAAPALVALGANLTYTITVTNNGPSASTGYAVTDTLPANVTFVSATSGCVLTTVLTCSGPALGVELNATYVVVVTPTALGALSNTASVTGNEPDTAPGNNSATSTVTVAAAVADVAVAMTASPSPVAVLGSVTYQISLTNNGPSPATGVVLTDTLPADTLFASIDDLTHCAVSNGALTCNFDSFAAGGSTTVNLILVPLVVPSGEGTFTNTATVTANEPDPALPNNSATQTVQVTGANLSGGGALRNLPGFSNTITPGNDDGSFGPVPLGFSVNFFGVQVSSLFVNNNGNVTFGSPLGTYTPFPLPTTNLQIIAPYFSDVGTYQIGSGLVTYGNDTVNGRPAFGVNWPNVDYFGEAAPTLLNLFQLVLVDRSDVNPGDLDIEFNYDKMQWETGTASGGVDGLGGASARVGYSNGTGITGSYFEFPGSGVPGSFLDSNAATGLIYSTLNSTQPGRYIFQVRNGVVQSSADLAITATGPQYAVAGSTVTYALTAVNGGPNTATGVTVTDTLPVGLTFVSATPGTICPTPPIPAAGQPVVVTCNVGSIANGSTVNIVIQATVAAGVSGSLTNTAVIAAPNNQDLNLGNNTATVVTSANVADLAVSAAGAPSPVGGFPAFAATVTNNGPAGATNVVLTDLLDNYGFVSASSTQGACTFSAPTVTCSLGTLANGASAVVTVAVTAPNAGWAANTYHASADQPDLNPINNSFRLGPSLDSFNTPVGSNVAVNISDPADNLVALTTFSTVTRIGSTTMASMSATIPPPGFRSGLQPAFFDISTNAEYAGAIALNIHFLPANFRHPALVRLFHFEGGTWVDRTTGLNASSGVIAGQVMSLSPFALLEPVDTIPVANAGGDRSVPGSMAAGARVTLDGAASVDADGDPLTYRWSGPFPEGGGTVTGINPTVTLPLGVSKVSLVVNDGEADSPAVAANIAVADFQVSAPAGSVALNRGQSTTFTITMTPQYGAFGAPINLSCAPGAADVTCSFSSASVTPGAAAAAATLTVTAVSTVARAPGRSMPAYIAVWFGTLPVFGMVFLAAGRRKKWQMAVLLMLLLLLVASHIGCGGGGTTQTQSSSRSTPGAKAVSITVTGTSGTLQHSSSVTVTIPQ